MNSPILAGTCSVRRRGDSHGQKRTTVLSARQGPRLGRNSSKSAHAPLGSSTNIVHRSTDVFLRDPLGRLACLSAPAGRRPMQIRTSFPAAKRGLGWSLECRRIHAISAFFAHCDVGCTRAIRGPALLALGHCIGASPNCPTLLIKLARWFYQSNKKATRSCRSLFKHNAGEGGNFRIIGVYPNEPQLPLYLTSPTTQTSPSPSPYPCLCDRDEPLPGLSLTIPHLQPPHFPMTPVVCCSERYPTLALLVDKRFEPRTVLTLHSSITN